MPEKFLKKQFNPKSIALAVVLVGVLMAAIDATIVILAMPTIDFHLNTSYLNSIWIILGYILVLAVLSSQVGRIGDRYGRAKLYKYGLIIFTIGSGLCGFAPNINFLIGSRILQALGGVLIGTLSSAVIADHFEPHERGRAFGYTAIGWNFGAILGIFLGGFLTTINWRLIFFINIPIGIILILFAIFKLHDVVKLKKEPIDFVGSIILGIGLVILTLSAVFSMFEGITYHEILLFLVSLIFFILFILWEKRTKFPIIDFILFKQKIFSFSILASMLQAIASFAVLFILILYLQGVRGLNPFVSSMYLLPGYFLGAFVAPAMGRLSDKIGARIPATLGLISIVIGYLAYSLFLGYSTPLYYVAIITILTGMGSAMFYPANNSAIMANAPKDHYAMASGLNRMLGNVGMVISFVLALTVIAGSISRSTAFAIFSGNTISLSITQSINFIKGMDSAFFASIIVLILAIVLSYIRGKEDRKNIKN
ncbi:MAG: MFS transporter [Candidatus Marsarchaeota archaeon]|nr:MFS transporter [Candidatus Marsarchaeota archaeon]MCL5094539.1 MFS transporter [Candidatus Marsarchaeota archaeon]